MIRSCDNLEVLVFLIYKYVIWDKVLPKSRKRVTATSRAKISVTKARKVINKGFGGSYPGDKETVK